MKRPSVKASKPAKPRRMLLELDPDIRQALEMLGRDRMQELQELADEAFRDLLKKHRRPVTLKEQLRQSSRAPANDEV
jgi:hypothetical protein